MIREKFQNRWICGVSYIFAAWIVRLFGVTPAFADTPVISGPSSAFASVGSADWAHAWINYLFRGTPLPDAMAAAAAPFAPVAEGLRQALGLYSFGMLMVAALLVFFHIAGMVAETAHYGTVFGRRANQVWMPIRFVLAIGLLVPVSGSLNAGQYLVIKIAGEGSTMASNAWRMVASVGGEHLAGLVEPRGPDVARLAATAVEMETCRLVYQQTYTQMQEDPVVRIAGNMNGMVKIPASRFVNEIWRTTNMLNATAPLCGEVRFEGYRRPGFLTAPAMDAVAFMTSELSTFAHEQADDLFARARMIAARAAPVFFGTVAPTGADIQNDLTTIEDIYRTRLETERQAIGVTGPRIAASVLQDSVDAGWLAAARFILDIVRLQESYGEAFNNALPTAQEPVFDHPLVARQVLVEALDTLPSFRPLDQEGFGKLATFYGQVGRVMGQIHSWIYASQIPEKDFVPPSSFDLRDRLNAASDPAAAFSLYAQAVDAAALERGVWGGSPDGADAGYPFAPVAANAATNPFAALVEFGQRQVDLASLLFGIAGSGIASANTAGPAVLLGAAAAALFLGGLMLVFLVPLLPFLRFLMGILAWAVNVFEAVVAIPVVALAHLTPAGEGLSGGLARQAYMLWLGLFIRPLLTLFGFVLGLLLFILGLTFLNVALTPFARLAAPSNEGLFIVANLGLVLLYDVLAYIVANVSFKGIHGLPDQALRWISTFTLTDSGGASVAGPAGAPGPAGFSSLMYFPGSAPSGAAGSGTVNVGPPGTMGSAKGGSPTARSHATKTALFPLYSDKPTSVQPPGVAGGGQTGVDRSRTEKTTVVSPDKKKPKTISDQEQRDPGLVPKETKDGETPPEDEIKNGDEGTDEDPSS